MLYPICRLFPLVRGPVALLKNISCLGKQQAITRPSKLSSGKFQIDVRGILDDFYFKLTFLWPTTVGHDYKTDVRTGKLIPLVRTV